MRIAITGGLAEGKSTVLAMLAQAGHTTISADEVVRELWEDPAIIAEIGRRLALNGPVSKSLVRDVIAENPEKRRLLNAFFHPEVRRRVRASGAQFSEIPLLIEGVSHDEYDAVWVVTCGPEEQLRRLQERVGSESEARRLLSMQLPTRAKLAFADRVIRTNATFSSVLHDVLDAAQIFG